MHARMYQTGAVLEGQLRLTNAHSRPHPRRRRRQRRRRVVRAFGSVGSGARRWERLARAWTVQGGPTDPIRVHVVRIRIRIRIGWPVRSRPRRCRPPSCGRPVRKSVVYRPRPRPRPGPRLGPRGPMDKPARRLRGRNRSTEVNAATAWRALYKRSVKLAVVRHAGASGRPWTGCLAAPSYTYTARSTGILPRGRVLKPSQTGTSIRKSIPSDRPRHLTGWGSGCVRRASCVNGREGADINLRYR